ncbi:hypothetical protein BDY19DRAFT_942831 [Irpex rosettiformis]|uniref:Uncharacterized protein n=1 Tax=Irpex rosettiformis TaxID=378272 RepID=A0ACB8U5Q6_9APHY|nr:hypothetical protein BDY19DRAFT_942831 [Irpex rosettiformis]
MPPPCLSVRRLTTLSSAASSVHRGTAFEHWSMQVLHTCLSMSLSRVGGRADGGVDLQGWWWLPSQGNSLGAPPIRRRIRVLAQCKAEKKKIGPKYVREMEGVLHQFNASMALLGPHPEAPADWCVDDESPRSPTVGMFISNSPFTQMALTRALSSSLPLALLYLPIPVAELLPKEQLSDSDDGPSVRPDAIGSVVFNSALGGTSGILEGEIEPRWEYPTKPGGIGRPMLWWQGRRLPSYSPS